MNETIDQTQWLPRNTPVVNPYRLAKGDLEGVVKTTGGQPYIAHAQVVDKSVARILTEKGLLEAHHYPYGITLLELRDAYFGRALGTAFTSCMEMFLPRPVSKAEIKEIYAAVALSMTINRVRIIEQAMNKTYEEDAAAQCMPGINAYRECFEMLVTCMDEARENIEKNVAE